MEMHDLPFWGLHVNLEKFNTIFSNYYYDLYEIYEDNESLKNFYSYVYKASLEWDGKNPVRNITEII